MDRVIASTAAELDRLGWSDAADRLDRIEHDPEVAALVAAARRDLLAMSRTAQIEPIVQDLEDDLDEEDEVETCEDCGNPVEDCQCPHCDECGEKISECECERCSNCDELMRWCRCDRCSECNELEDDCECERCSDCGSIMENCECDRCSGCNDLVDECECEKCPDCDKSMVDCNCDFRDPAYLNRLRRAMMLGLNIFARVAPAYGPIADAMAYYLSGRGGQRRLDASIMSDDMKRRMIGKALTETDWMTRLNAGDDQPVAVLWDYGDYLKIRPGHQSDHFSAENATRTEPMHYVAGGFTYHLRPRVLRGGKIAIDVHLEDTYDFENKKDDANTTYDLGTLASNERIMQIAQSLAKRFVGDLVSITDSKVVLDDRMLSAMAEEGLAAPFTTVIDGTLMVLPAGQGPLGDRLVASTVDNFAEFDDWDDRVAELMLRTRPGDVNNIDPRRLTASKRLSLPMVARLFAMRANPEDVGVLSYLDTHSSGQDILEALLPTFARIAPDAVEAYLVDSLRQLDWHRSPTIRNNMVQSALAKLPHLDPRRQMSLPFEEPGLALPPPLQQPEPQQQPQPEPEQPTIPGLVEQAAVRLAARLDARGAHDLADRLDRIARWEPWRHGYHRGTQDEVDRIVEQGFTARMNEEWASHHLWDILDALPIEARAEFYEEARAEGIDPDSDVGYPDDKVLGRILSRIYMGLHPDDRFIWVSMTPFGTEQFGRGLVHVDLEDMDEFLDDTDYGRAYRYTLRPGEDAIPSSRFRRVEHDEYIEHGPSSQHWTTDPFRGASAPGPDRLAAAPELYHGTSEELARQIMRSGLIRGRDAGDRASHPGLASEPGMAYVTRNLGHEPSPFGFERRPGAIGYSRLRQSRDRMPGRPHIFEARPRPDQPMQPDEDMFSVPLLPFQEDRSISDDVLDLGRRTLQDLERRGPGGVRQSHLADNLRHDVGAAERARSDSDRAAQVAAILRDLLDLRGGRWLARRLPHWSDLSLQAVGSARSPEPIPISGNVWRAREPFVPRVDDADEQHLVRSIDDLLEAGDWEPITAGTEGSMSRFSRIVENGEFRTVRLRRDGRTFDVRITEARIDEVMREAGLDPVRIRLYPSRHSREEFAQIAAIDRLAVSCDPSPPEVVEVVQGDSGFADQISRMYQDRARLGFRFPSDPNPRPSRVEHVRPVNRGHDDRIRTPGRGSYRG